MKRNEGLSNARRKWERSARSVAVAIGQNEATTDAHAYVRFPLSQDSSTTQGGVASTMGAALPRMRTRNDSKGTDEGDLH